MGHRIIVDRDGTTWHFSPSHDGNTIASSENSEARLIAIPYDKTGTLGDQAMELLASEPLPEDRIRGLVEAAELSALELILADPSHQEAIDKHGHDGFTPLFFAVLNVGPPYRFQLIEVLIRRGANPYVTQDFPAVGFLSCTPYGRALDDTDSKLFAYLLYSRHIDVPRLYRFVTSDKAQQDREGRKLLKMLEIIEQYLEEKNIRLPPPESERRTIGGT